MTEHKATSGQWEALEEHSWQDAYSCILELRARMGALEDAQRLTVKDSLTVPADSLTAPVTRDRAEDASASSDSLVDRVADAIYRNCADGTGDGFRETIARPAILGVADWFEQQGFYTTAARLRQEVR